MSAKSLLRSAIAKGAQFSGLLRLVEYTQRNTLTILCYHRVLPQARRGQYFDPALVVTPEMFDAHCKALAKHFDVVTLEQGYEAWQQGLPSKRPRAAITFDDGYRDNETYAAPILARHGLKATFYVVAGLVGTDEQPWYDRAGGALTLLGLDPTLEVNRAKQLTPTDRQVWLDALETKTRRHAAHPDDLIMDGAALRRLVADGHRIGSHTISHPLLDQLDNVDLYNEVVRSKAMLEATIGSEVVGFSYPNGNFNEPVKAAVAQGHYAYAVSAKPGVNHRGRSDVLALKRWFISQERLSTPGGVPSAALLRMELSGLSQRLFKRRVAS